MSKKKSFWVKLAHKRLSSGNNFQDNEELYTLSKDEISQLKKIRLNTYLKAGIAGFLGIALLYIPYHLWGEALFPKRTFNLPFIANPVELEIEFLIYSLVLVFLEIWYLTYINISAVDQISKTCGSPNPNDPFYENHIEDLINIGLDKKQKELEKLGINPYDGLSKWGVFAFQTLIRLKATLSGFIWKILVGRILGRYAFRMLVDLLGGPLYAFWNILGARKVMNEARVRVMAPPLIKNFVELLSQENVNSPELRRAIINGLQVVATSKRAFHYNHYLLASTILSRFDLTIDPSADFEEDFVYKIDELPKSIQKSIVKLIVFGIIIDGKLSLVEKRTLIKLHKEGVLPYTYDQVKGWSKDYFEGRGLEKFFVT